MTTPSLPKSRSRHQNSFEVDRQSRAVLRTPRRGVVASFGRAVGARVTCHYVGGSAVSPGGVRAHRALVPREDVERPNAVSDGLKLWISGHELRRGARHGALDENGDGAAAARAH